ncbi:MAG: sortase [Acidimicrobiales bacterium]
MLIVFLREKRWARRTLTGVTAGLVLIAVILLAYPLYSNFVTNELQSKLRHQLASPQLKNAYQKGQLRVGDSLTRLQIPSLGVDVVVVEGTTANALRAGAGHYVGYPLPCTAGNVPIAGHRTTYGKPFTNLDQLKPGDDIILTTPVGTCTYKVDQAPFTVLPDDLAVVSMPPNPTPPAGTQNGGYLLTLTTCTPKGSASHRLIVQAAMVPSQSA